MLLLVALAGPPALARDYVLEVGAGRLTHAGFLQTPAGGEPGTATHRRPTFAELNLQGGSYRWVAGAVDFGRFAFRARFTNIGEVAGAQLDLPLTSQGQTFAMGETVRSRATLDRLSLAFTRSFGVADGTALELGPWLGWTAFDLGIEGAASRVDRSYRVYAVGLTAGLSKRLGKRWHVGFAGTLAPAFDGAAGQYSGEPSIGFLVREVLEVRLGLRFDAFRYDDSHKQTLPNRLRVTRRVAPALSVLMRL